MERVGGPAPGRSDVSVAALGTMLFLSTLKIWLPSVSFIYGRVGSTPATELALFALVPFVVAVVAAYALPWGHSRSVVVTAGALLALARLGIQATDGGDAQLWLATGGVVVGLVWLMALVGHAGGLGVLALGIALGLAGDAAAEVVLGGADLLWFGGAGSWLVLAALVLAFAVVLTAVPEDEPAASASTPWIALGPLLVLHGVLCAPTRLSALTGWSMALAGGLLVLGYLVGLMLVTAGPALPNRLWLVTTVLVVVPGALAVTGVTTLAAIGTIVLPVGLLLSLVLMDGAPGHDGVRARATMAAWGLLLFFVLAFLYYGSYDLSFGIDSVILPAAAIALLPLLTLFGTAAGPPRSMAAPRGPIALGAGALLLAVVVAAAVRAPTTGTITADGLPIRVMLYNVHMGYDTEGRYVPDELADVINAESPDVVVLNEVDRGWLLNGTNDVLLDLARETGMSWTFAPAADDIWGNAILSRYPLLDPTVIELPDGDAPMGRSVLTASIDVGGERITIVGTHLHHRDEDPDIRTQQAVVIANVVKALGDDQPVVVMGDLNAEPSDPELNPLDGLTNVTLVDGPILTYPSWSPIEHIDHILVTGGLTGRDVSVPSSTASDHLGVVVTLERSSS